MLKMAVASSKIRVWCWCILILMIYFMDVERCQGILMIFCAIGQVTSMSTQLGSSKNAGNCCLLVDMWSKREGIESTSGSFPLWCTNKCSHSVSPSLSLLCRTACPSDAPEPLQHVLRIREYQALKGFPDIYLKAMRVTAILVLTIGCEGKCLFRIWKPRECKRYRYIALQSFSTYQQKAHVFTEHATT